MKTLSITPSRWFDPVFEVPVIRRIPQCRQAFPDQAQATSSRHRRRLRSPFVRQCANNQGLLNQLV